MMDERLDHWLSETIRNAIEQRFYAKINQQATFAQLARDPAFLTAPAEHVGLYTDHGVVHVRDIAHQVLDVLTNCHGVLLAPRSPERFRRMQGFAVLLAYFHDIGMVDSSIFGRAMHPEFAAQAVFAPVLDALIDAIWRENSGGLAWYLHGLTERNVLRQMPKLVLRELLSLAVGHSKSKVPVATLNDPHALRAALIAIATSDLRTLYRARRKGQPIDLSTGASRWLPDPPAQRFPDAFPEPAYQWLTAEHPELQALAEDAIDTVRALRAADALRQRGSVLVTSGGYQIFVDRVRGNALYALHHGDDELYLLELHRPLGSGEANIASSELEPAGDLRISFHRGFFSQPGAQQRVAQSTALVVHDIQRDVVDSFRRSTDLPGLKTASAMLILVEETEDDPRFPYLMLAELRKLDPAVAASVRITPSLKDVHPRERGNYVIAEPLTWPLAARRELLLRMEQPGYPASKIDPDAAFQDVRLLTIRAGDVLVEAGAPPAFVYLPLESGLKIHPLGGHPPLPAQPWMLLGSTAVIRGAERNATVVGERRLQVLMIPKAVYWKYWHYTLTIEEFRNILSRTKTHEREPMEKSGELEKVTLLETIPLFRLLEQRDLSVLATRAEFIHVAEGESVIEQNALGRSAYVVAAGSLRVHDQELTLKLLGPGDIFGEIAAVASVPRTASVTAAEESTLLRLEQEDVRSLIKQNSAAAFAIIEVLAGYVSQANHAV